MKYYSDILSKEDNLLLAWKKKHPKTQGIPRNIVKGGKKRETWSEYQYSELFIYKNKWRYMPPCPNGWKDIIPFIPKIILFKMED